MAVRPLPAPLAEMAQIHLNEDSKRVIEDLQHIKDWIAKQPHLRARINDQWLIAFLRGCKFSLERTKEKLDLYYSLRSIAPELYRIKHTDPIFDEVVNSGYLLILPKTATPDSPRVSIVRPGKYNPEKYSIIDVMAVTGNIQKLLFMEDDHTIVAGSITILDLAGVTMEHFLQVTQPTNIKKMVVAGQDAAPLRMQSMHFLNTPPGFETILSLIKPMISEKNRDRIHVHNTNYEAMYKFIPKEILPTEYGGNGGNEEDIVAYWKEKVREYSSFLEEDRQFGTDETKRRGKPRTAESEFGVQGSFRLLEMD